MCLSPVLPLVLFAHDRAGGIGLAPRRASQTGADEAGVKGRHIHQLRAVRRRNSCREKVSTKLEREPGLFEPGSRFVRVSLVTLPIRLPQLEASVCRKYIKNPSILIFQNCPQNENGSISLPKVQNGSNNLPKVHVH